MASKTATNFVPGCYVQVFSKFAVPSDAGNLDWEWNNQRKNNLLYLNMNKVLRSKSMVFLICFTKYEEGGLPVNLQNDGSDGGKHRFRPTNSG
jgi:hypothetical protein